MRYEEEQNFAAWIYGLLLVADVAVLAGIIAAAQEEPEVIWVALVVVPLVLWPVDLMFLYTRVGDGEIYVQLGRFIPSFWKHIPLAEVSEARVVKYNPIRDGGGWGWRIGRFEGKGCWFYNARGNRGVFFKTPRRNYIIGSQDPEALLRAIEEHRSKSL